MRSNQERLPIRRDGSYGTGSLSPFSEWSESSGSFFSGNPWQMMRRMQEDMDRMFGQAFGGGAFGNFGGFGGGQMTQWSPSIDVSQTDKEWCIEADLPGVNQEDIDVHVRDNHLFLRAEMRQRSNDSEGDKGNRQYYRRERSYGMVERVFPLPQEVQEDQIRCDFRDGVLTIHVPKSERQLQQGRRIPIGQAAGGGGQTFGGGKENASEAGEGEKARTTGDRSGKTATGAEKK